VSSSTPFLVGIAGGSGSGKTSFLRDLLLHFPAQKIALVSQDNYYEPKHLQQVDENGVINFDLPTSINREYFYSDMMKLMQGESIELMEYNFNNPAALPKKVVVNPAPIIIMEGLFVFHYEEIRKKLNYKVFIDVHHEERLQRRIKRDGAERGYPEHEVIYQWQNHVRPSEEEFLYPYLPECDLIVDNTIHYREGLQTLVGTIHQSLAV
jgi:uridine kinase